MTAEVLLDTNILMYAAQNAALAPEKKALARQIVLEEDYSTSAQVLAEFYVNAIRKGPSPLSSDQAQRWVDALRLKPCQPVDAGVVARGIELSRAYQISYWDAAIIAAAEELGCKRVYSEDLAHGQTYGSVTVINPFLDS